MAKVVSVESEATCLPLLVVGIIVWFQIYERNGRVLCQRGLDPGVWINIAGNADLISSSVQVAVNQLVNDDRAGTVSCTHNVREREIQRYLRASRREKQTLNNTEAHELQLLC